MSSTLISLLKAEEAKKEKSKVSKSDVVQAQNEYIQEPEESRISGQPVNQKVVNQLTSLVNQSEEALVNQSEEVLVNQTTDEKLYRSRKQRKLKGLRLPSQKLKKWELWCFMNKVDFQDAVEQAMDWLTSQPVNHILIDDLDDNKEIDEIIIFYRKWTGNNIRPKDRAAREEVKKFSDNICKIGILTAILRAKSTINSFRYCIPVIEEVAASTAEFPVTDENAYLKYLQQTMLNVRKGT